MIIYLNIGFKVLFYDYSRCKLLVVVLLVANDKIPSSVGISYKAKKVLLNMQKISNPFKTLQ